MSVVNEARYLVQHELCECKWGLQRENGIIMNAGLSVKN